MRDLRKPDTHVCMDDSTDKRLRRSAREGARLEGGRAGDPVGGGRGRRGSLHGGGLWRAAYLLAPLGWVGWPAC